MYKLYIETSDLDNAIISADLVEPASGVAIQKLESAELQNFAARIADAQDLPVDVVYHTLTAGIVFGLELGKSQLALDVSAYDDVLLSLLGV